MVKWILIFLAIAGVLAILGRNRLAKAAATVARVLVRIRSFQVIKRVLPI